MRVIAGTAKGRRLTAPKGQETRPTSDRVREALFSILGAHVVEARVLDLFAGSGALGIEALSRGAASALFADSAAPAAAAVRANLDGIDGGEVLQRPARVVLRDARADERQYDLVFLDPPYAAAPAIGAELGELIAAVLAPEGLVVSESSRRSPLDLATLDTIDERRYGDTLIRLHAHR